MEYCRTPVSREDFDPYDPKTWSCEALTEFREEGVVKYLIKVLWKAEPKELYKTKRMQRQGGWLKSGTIEYFDVGREIWLTGKERKSFVRNKLEPRLHRALGSKDLSRESLYRSRFNYACFWEEADLKGYDLHHRPNFEVDVRYRDFQGATNDDPRWLEVLTRAEHAMEHEGIRGEQKLLGLM